MQHLDFGMWVVAGQALGQCTSTDSLVMVCDGVKQPRRLAPMTQLHSEVCEHVTPSQLKLLDKFLSQLVADVNWALREKPTQRNIAEVAQQIEELAWAANEKHLSPCHSDPHV
jgi:hypothetical protein